MAEQKSDLSRAFSEDGALKTHVGGQALIEGIMMRGKYNWSVAVREPDGGIYVEEHDLASGRKKNGWMYWPLVRGCRAMLESLVLGYKALEIAALHAFAEEGEDEPAAAEEAGGSAARTVLLARTVRWTVRLVRNSPQTPPAPSAMASNLLPTPTLTAATMRALNPFLLQKPRRRGLSPGRRISGGRIR